jgi:S1-C subfamily serine protease
LSKRAFKLTISLLILFSFALLFHQIALAQDEVQSSSAIQQVPQASRGGNFAITSVFRVVCPAEGSYGTGFLHKSGMVITADHILAGCLDPVIFLYDNSRVPAKIISEDSDLDLALLKPSRSIDGHPLTISRASGLPIGAEVALWGFPNGYNGVRPMLSVGYLSAADAVRTDSGKPVLQLVLNAAINLGNSGGPVVDTQTGEVVGVVNSKLAPLSPNALAALNALERMGSGVQYEVRSPDGTMRTVSEAQVVGIVLDDLRQQVQLVIGRAVMLNDLWSFLTKAHLDV